MRNLLAILTVVALAVTATAGMNPQVNAYISFDPAGDPLVNAVAPAPYTTVSAYVTLGCVEGGMTTISFLINNVMAQCPGVMATQAFVNLLPGDLAIGNAFTGGITLASTECMAMDPVVVGRVDCFYLGGACCIQILDHADYPRWVVDCQDPGVVDYYCLAGHGSVGGAVCPDGEVCPCGGVPVEDTTWGGIKALYR
jgi:hypothetical protein